MCGIAGFAGPLDIDAAGLIRMTDRVAHRGPDAAGRHLVPGEAGLGFRRLSIIDLETGNQPLYSEDRAVVATCNGEIYNFHSLLDGLRSRGHTFRSRSDVEVIAHLYEEHGVGFLSHLEGMFAVALWDARAKSLILAVDRLGVKPLYWTRVADGIVYGSEPGALLASGLIDAAPDLEAIGEYLTLQYVQAPRSGFAGIQKLAPGEWLRFQRGNVEVRSWWTLQHRPRSSSPSPQEAVAEADDLLRAATQRRLMSDVPLGAFLSGGVDSSVVVSYMAEMLPEVRTFSIDFPVAGFSEGAHARRVAEIYGTRHEEFLVEPDMVPLVAEAVKQLGEPFADSSAIPTFLLSQLTRRHVTVALSGDGGDEAFGGYLRYRIAAEADRMGLPAQLAARFGRRLMPQTLARRYPRVARGLKALARPADERYAALMAHFDPDPILRLVGDVPEILDGAGRAWHEILRPPPIRGLNRYMALDIATYLPGDLLVKVDRMSMAHALEVRSPMLDHRVHEFAAALPANLKLRRGTLKWTLKQVALRRGLPSDLVHRTKQGFGIPIGDWFRRDLREWLIGVLTDPHTRARGYFRNSEVDGLLQAHFAGNGDYSPRLWNLMMLELWHRAWIDGEA